METAKRDMTFLLAAPERRVLRWVAARLPRRLVPDHLTIIGVLGAVVTATGYALSGRDAVWLWLASAGLVLNWFGDSLDGTLARVRHIERPKYGYYIDHMIDAPNTALIGAGIGLSPYVPLPVAMLLVILYLCLSINVYLESSVHGEFDFGFGVLGPTEGRILLALLNTGVFGAVTWGGLAPAAVARGATVVFAAGCVALGYALAARFRINLLRLSRIEPPRRP